MLSYYLYHEAWIGFHSKLLESHIDVWVNCMEVFEFLAGEEAVILSLILNLESNFRI